MIKKHISKKSSPSFWFSFVVHVCLLIYLLLTSITLPDSLEAFKLEMTISPAEALNKEPITLLRFDGADIGSEITPADMALTATLPLAINLTSFSDALVEDSIRNIEADSSTFASMKPADLFVDLESELKAEGTLEASREGINGGGQGKGKTSTNISATTSFYGVRGTGNRFAFVCDVSGSMDGAPFQRLMRELQESITRLPPHAQFYVVFFNDDDEKSNDQTRRKDSTGMWTISSYSYKKVLATAVKAMENGDHIENNLEAVCRAIEEYPEDKYKILMIADNWEDPCDMHLLNYLKEKKIPVRIIVCGVEDSFNTKYLEIAYATGGTIHTMEDDLKNLASMKDGTTFKIGKIKYKIAKGKFYQVR